MKVTINFTKEEYDLFIKRAQIVGAAPEDIMRQLSAPYFEGSDEDFELYMNFQDAMEDPDLFDDLFDEEDIDFDFNGEDDDDFRGISEPKAKNNSKVFSLNDKKGKKK